MIDGNNLKITVVLRTYKRPEFLKRSLRSIELQTYDNWEVLIYDDSSDIINLSIIDNFKSKHKSKRILYTTSFESHDLFKKSWSYSINDSNGDILVRLDDDDVLDSDALSYINKLYLDNPDLDFSYGSSVIFKNDELITYMESRTPHEVPKTRDIWSAYAIENNHPWNKPWSFTENYYETPQHYTSIIHASKANELCVYHTYVMRKKSVETVIDKITVTSNTHDDLEFFGSLEYLGLKHSSIKKVLTFVGSHDQGRVTENKDIIKESFRVRDKVDYLRPNNFKTNILEIKTDSTEEIGINDNLKLKFRKLINELSHNLLHEKAFLFYVNKEYSDILEYSIKSIRQFSNIPILIYTLNFDKNYDYPNVQCIRWNCDIRNENDNLFYLDNNYSSNKFIDRNKEVVYDTLVQRPLITKHALLNYAKTICYLDADTIVLPKIDNIFDLYPENISFPYFTQGIYDFMIWEGRGGYDGNLSNTLEHHICQLYNIDQSFRLKTTYKQTGYFIAGQNSIEFLTEWSNMCQNPTIKLNNKLFAPYHEETIVNCLLWNKQISDGLPLVYVNGGKDTINKIANEWNFTGKKQKIEQWVTIPESREQLFFIHGEKRIEELKEMLIRTNSLIKKVDPSMNWGDIISHKILEFFSQKDIDKNLVFHFDKEGKILTKNGKIHCVGSTLQYTKSNDYVWGTGCIKPGFIGEKPKKIYAVRGPLTRQELIYSGIDCPEIYGDPALLFPLIYNPTINKKYKFGLIPHYVDYTDANSKKIINHIEKIGVKIIDITSGVEEVIDQIKEVEFILSSSLHGIILSDAYKIPNIKVKLSDLVIGGDFKFKDYYLSINKEFISENLTPSTSYTDIESFNFIIGDSNITNNLLSNSPWRDKDNDIFYKKMKLLYIAPHLSTGGMPGFLLKRIESIKKFYTDIEIFVVEYSNYSPLYVSQKNKIKELIGENNFFTLDSNKYEIIQIIKDNNIDIVHIEEVIEGFDFHNKVPIDLMNEIYSNNRTWYIVETCHNVWFDPSNNKKVTPDGFAFCTPYHQQVSFSNLNSHTKLIEFPIDNLIPSHEEKISSKRKLGLDEGKIHVINVGLWTKGKNQSEGIEIAKNVFKVNPNIEFHFIGNQAPNFKEYWEPLMNNLPPNVKVWGERDDVSLFMKSADMFMFNSTWECNPLVLKEAISHGLKILARNLPQYLGIYKNYIIELNNDPIVSSNILLESLDNKIIYSIPKENSENFAKLHYEFYNEIIKLPIKKQPLLNSSINVTQHFVNQPFLEINGEVSDPNTKFDIIFYDEKGKIQYQNLLPINHWVKLNRKYYTKWKTQIFENGNLIYENILSFKDKRVYIAFDSKSLGDTIAWIPYCLEFKLKHECELIVSTFWNKLFKDVYPELTFVTPGEVVHNLHGMYKLGWFYDADSEPTLPNTIPLQKTATNILGLDYTEIMPRINFTPRNNPIKSKYVTIATNSTAGCKFWTKDGWQQVINYLNDLGYTVINVSKEDNPFKNCKKIKDTSIEYTMNTIYHSEFFIGLSSGLSWLSWALNKKVIMISNFTTKDHEFQSNCLRLTNENVCNGCWNNPNFMFDKGDWNWCPVHKGTNRQFECQKSITPLMVIDRIQELI